MSVHKHFYCVCCNRQRFLVAPTHFNSKTYYFQILITTAFLSILSWPWFHAKGFFAFFIPVGLCFDFVYRFRFRGSLECPDCHFDPILYLSNRPQALTQVKAAWRKKFEKNNLIYPIDETQVVGNPPSPEHKA